ncbi:hypothetical protein EVAR_79333_1 [Eumeta japonica]|uniref:Uncharacterized protein n=1 Tax=Eumeta variegata TaxID=151549 RepID=A0A4C1THF5_EUMVA|nr:hypothetical protein EVAR_79333_1 [Eumeta japonica]
MIDYTVFELLAKNCVFTWDFTDEEKAVLASAVGWRARRPSASCFCSVRRSRGRSEAVSWRWRRGAGRAAGRPGRLAGPYDVGARGGRGGGASACGRGMAAAAPAAAGLRLEDSTDSDYDDRKPLLRRISTSKCVGRLVSTLE